MSRPFRRRGLISCSHLGDINRLCNWQNCPLPSGPTPPAPILRYRCPMNPTAERKRTQMKTNETKKNSALLMGVVTGALAVFFAVGCASYRNEAQSRTSPESGAMTTSEEQLPPSPPKSVGMIADTARK